MAAGITFKIGGLLSPSYRTALAQSIIEARAANQAIQKEMAVSSGIAVDMSRLGQFKQWKKERLAGIAEEARLEEALRIGGTRGVSKSTDAAADAAFLSQNGLIKVRVAEIAAKKAADIENDIESKASLVKLQLAKKVASEKSLYNAIYLAQFAKDEAEQVAISKAADLAMLTTIATGGGARSNASGGVHGQGGVAGIVRESIVIMREIAMGRGGGRIAGSATILAQYLGLLNKAVKSTASEQLLASVAASKLSKVMAVQALQARGTAAFTELLAASQAQEAAAATAATEANIALGAATITLNPIFFVIAGAILAAGAAAFFLWRHFSRLATEAKNLADALNPLKKKLSEVADEQIRVAEGMQKETDYLRDLNDEHQTEVELLSAKVKLLKEEQTARRKTMEARGAGQSELQAFDRAALEAQKKMLEAEQKRLQLEKITSQEDQFMAAAQAANGAPGLAGAKKVFDNAKAIADAAQAAMETAPKIMSSPGSSGSWSPTGALPTYRSANENDKVSVNVGGKDMGSMTVAEAQANLAVAQARIEKLAVLQKKYDDIEKDATKTANEKAAGLKQVRADIDAVNGELKIAQTDPKTRREHERRSATERERVGIGAPQVANLQKQTLDVSKLQLAAAHLLNSKIDRLIASGGGAGNPDGW